MYAVGQGFPEDTKPGRDSPSPVRAGTVRVYAVGQGFPEATRSPAGTVRATLYVCVGSYVCMHVNVCIYACMRVCEAIHSDINLNNSISI